MTKDEKNNNENEFILEHKYNPKFELLNEEEINNVLEKFNIKLIDLPKMSLNDPISKLFEAKVNDVFKIVRNSQTCGESVFYRVVINE